MLTMDNVSSWEYLSYETGLQLPCRPEDFAIFEGVTDWICHSS